MKRVFIIHGWSGYPEECWFPWLKKELENKGFQVHVPSMPNTEEPIINRWVHFLKKQVGTPDEETFFVGHSIGCQTILRYLGSLEPHTKVGGVILVAGFIHLKPIIKENKEDYEIAKPWLETPIYWDKILTHTNRFVSIFSDNDRWVPVEDSKIFEKKLKSKTIIEHNKGHMGASDNVPELPVVLDELLKMDKE